MLHMFAMVFEFFQAFSQVFQTLFQVFYLSSCVATVVSECFKVDQALHSMGCVWEGGDGAGDVLGAHSLLLRTLSGR
jgi:hypothetical protein